MAEFINITFPIEDDENNGFLFKRNKTTREAIRTKIILLLVTQKGQRWYFPDFGTNLRRFLFEPNDEIGQFDIEEDVKSSVEKFIKNVTIEKIEFNPIEDENGNVSEEAIELFLRFRYQEGQFTSIDEINIRFTV